MRKPATTGNLLRRTALKHLTGLEIAVGITGCVSAVLLALLVSSPRIADVSSIGALFATGLAELALVHWKFSFYSRDYHMTQDELDALQAEGKLEKGATYNISKERPS